MTDTERAKRYYHRRRAGVVVVHDIPVSAAAVAGLRTFGLVRNGFEELPLAERRQALGEALQVLLNERLPQMTGAKG